MKCGRDIVFNATNSAPEEDFSEWSRLAECYYLWRRPGQGDGDIADSWKSISSIGFRMHEWGKYAVPGHWNDPDMLVVGHVGWGKAICIRANSRVMSSIPYISLLVPATPPRCSRAAILPNSIRLTTSSLLTNDEVLEVNQDPLGKMASRVSVREGREVWAKPMEDGSLAVGLFNRGEQATEVSVRWADLAIDGRWRVRDSGGSRTWAPLPANSKHPCQRTAWC